MYNLIENLRGIFGPMNSMGSDGTHGYKTVEFLLACGQRISHGSHEIHGNHGDFIGPISWEVLMVFIPKGTIEIYEIGM